MNLELYNSDELMKKHRFYSAAALLWASAFMSCDSKTELPKLTPEEEAIAKQKATLTLRAYEGRQFFVNFIDFGKGVGLSANFAHLRRDCSFRKEWAKGVRDPIEGVLIARNGQLVDSKGQHANAEGFEYGALLCPDCVPEHPPDRSGSKLTGAIPGDSPVPHAAHLTMEMLDDVRFPEAFLGNDVVLPFPKSDVSIETLNMKDRIIELKVTNTSSLQTLGSAIIELGFETPTVIVNSRGFSSTRTIPRLLRRRWAPVSHQVSLRT